MAHIFQRFANNLPEGFDYFLEQLIESIGQPLLTTSRRLLNEQSNVATFLQYL
jgi:hypothetical protein